MRDPSDMGDLFDCHLSESNSTVTDILIESLLASDDEFASVTPTYSRRNATRKQDTTDKKLHLTIARAEKARETEERSRQRNVARQALREQLTRDKAERNVEKERQVVT